ncbi:FecR family protein [Flavitalea sp. BT771]|uniref:FecR family protein n=1 Tax=Flavitalea sp. BT771 TaxID=3063329 RepID=UPI0026E13672|nr:FecR family protein [Flavitalea sp. BT771]MDO6431778.1 FecR family protein [Flavitalea sp. BT771]MDV6220686.1 FecR family protein [Flavitalea sp. BT771]
MQEDQFKQEERFWLLVSLRLAGEATPEELDELDAWLVRCPEMGVRMEMLHGLWESVPSDARRGGALNRHLQRLSNHLSAPALNYETTAVLEEEEEVSVGSSRWTRRLLWPALGIAAAIALVFLFVNVQEPRGEATRTAQNTVSTKRGSKSKIQLPDGSQVWLNADSRIIYDENFRGPFRQVQIIGEAYFDIAKDKDHPFIIHANSIDIKVLGTSLNIRSYNNEKNTETVLIRGSIEVTLRSSPDKKIILQPNEKLVVQNGKAIVVKNKPVLQKEEPAPVMTLGKAHLQEKDSTAMDILWVKNQLAFDKETLEDAARKIERWYDVKVTIKDERLKHTEYSAVFEDESLRQVMEALRMTGNFRYVISKKEITITP